MHSDVIVEQLMTRGVVTISMDQTLERARELFHEHQFHHLVVTENGKVVGVLSDRDLLERLSPFIGKLAERTADVASLQRKIHQVMTRVPMTVRPMTLASEAGRLLLDGGVSCLPVLDAGGGIAGIITIRDIAFWALSCLAPEELRRAA